MPLHYRFLIAQPRSNRALLASIKEIEDASRLPNTPTISLCPGPFPLALSLAALPSAAGAAAGGHQRAAGGQRDGDRGDSGDNGNGTAGMGQRAAPQPGPGALQSSQGVGRTRCCSAVRVLVFFSWPPRSGLSHGKGRRRVRTGMFLFSYLCTA